MDKDTKNFFEKLAGINDDDGDEEFGKFIKPEEESEEIREKTVKKAVSNSKKANGKKEIEEPEEKIEIKDEEENSLSEIFDESEGELAIDFYQTPTHFIIESTIAGVEPENIDVNITPESVTIKGKREKFTNKTKSDDYLVQECYWGRFSRSVILPQEVDPDKSQATIKNGVLKVSLPKASKEKTKKIKVKFE